MFDATGAEISTPTEDFPDHYLVGLLNYPNSFVPFGLQNHTSGTLRSRGDGDLTCEENGYEPSCTIEYGPWDYVPSVGFSDIEFYWDNATGATVTGQFWCTTDNGFGSSTNSFDYPLHIHHMRIEKPFAYNHGGAVFHTETPYTETESYGVTLLHDPNGLIQWENGADIQVAYATPDSTWDDWAAMRVLTGRDFDLEGMAVKNATYAVMGEVSQPLLVRKRPRRNSCPPSSRSTRQPAKS